MILAVDMGNTNIVVGGIDNERTYFLERIQTDSKKTALEYAVIFKSLLSFAGVDPFDLSGAILSSVVPQANDAVLGAIKMVTAFDPVLVTPTMNTGIKNALNNPLEIGSDLLVTAVAGSAEYELPLAIIDMGTATTITVVDENKTFLGGAIHPGITVSLEALSNKTSLLPHVDINKGLTVIGANSADSMRSGVILGHAGMIDGIIDKMEIELGKKLNAVATGGLASKVIPFCTHDIKTDNNLLLKGMYILYQMNRPAEESPDIN